LEKNENEEQNQCCLRDRYALIECDRHASGNTISGNSVGGGANFGGGIFDSGNLQITSSTIVHNLASADLDAFGSGVYSSAPTTTDSSIIALNTATAGPDFTGGGRTPVDGLQYYWQ
jgi:hypothetical protein